DLLARLHTVLGVEVGKRLVEQEHLWLAHDRATDRDALALTARKLMRLALEHERESEDVGSLGDAALDLGLRLVAELECEGHVVAHGHMRIERVVLEHHGDVAPGRRDVIHDALTDAQRSGCDRLESGDHAQRGALSTTKRTDED